MAAKTKKSPVIQSKSEIDGIETPIELTIEEVLEGEIVNEVRDETVYFVHNGKEYKLDVYLKTLPFGITEPFFKRWAENDPKVVHEWVAAALVNKKGENIATEKQVGSMFVQPMVRAIFDKIWGADNIKKTMNQPSQDE